MEWQGFALVLAGAIALASYQIINKKSLAKDAPADCIGVVNFLGSACLLLAISLFFDPPNIANWFAYPGGLFWPLIVTSVLNVVVMYGGVRALKYGDASLIVPIAATQPMVVLIPSWLVLGEIPDAWGYAGLFLLAVGMYIFSFGEEVYTLDPETGEKEPWQPPRHLLWMGSSVKYYAPIHMLFRNKGVRIALVVAVCGAVSINFDKLSALRSSATFAPALILFFVGLIGLAKTLKTGEWSKVNKTHLGNFLLNPLFLTFALVCFWVAFHFGFAAYVGALKRTQAIFVLLLGWMFLNEMQVKKRWLGATIMTIGAALLSL